MSSAGSSGGGLFSTASLKGSLLESSILENWDEFGEERRVVAYKSGILSTAVRSGKDLVPYRSRFM